MTPRGKRASEHHRRQEVFIPPAKLNKTRTIAILPPPKAPPAQNSTLRFAASGLAAITYSAISDESSTAGGCLSSEQNARTAVA